MDDNKIQEIQNQEVKALFQRRFFIHSTQDITVQAGKSNKAVITTSTEPFELRHITGQVLAANPANANAPQNIKVMIRYTNTSGDVTEYAIGFNEIAGTAQLPYIVPVDERYRGAIIPPSTNIDFTFQNGDANDQIVRINWHGYKIENLRAYMKDAVARAAAVNNIIGS